MSDIEMQSEYDFTNSVSNPYAARIKQPITIRLERETISYFKELAVENGIPYQTLINMFLSQCAQEHRKPSFTWK
jgi:predicted DNA binding CopG/RHH family protein